MYVYRELRQPKIKPELAIRFIMVDGNLTPLKRSTSSTIQCLCPFMVQSKSSNTLIHSSYKSRSVAVLDLIDAVLIGQLAMQKECR